MRTLTPILMMISLAACVGSNAVGGGGSTTAQTDAGTTAAGSGDSASNNDAKTAGDVTSALDANIPTIPLDASSSGGADGQQASSGGASDGGASRGGIDAGGSTGASSSSGGTDTGGASGSSSGADTSGSSGGTDAGSSSGGPSGACTNEADKKIIDDPKFKDTVKNCASGALGNAKKATSCIIDKTGLSSGCGLCWGDLMDCTFKNCLSQCAFNPDSKGCTECLENNCYPTFKSCSGLNP